MDVLLHCFSGAVAANCPSLVTSVILETLMECGGEMEADGLLTPLSGATGGKGGFFIGYTSPDTVTAALDKAGEGGGGSSPLKVVSGGGPIAFTPARGAALSSSSRGGSAPPYTTAESLIHAAAMELDNPIANWESANAEVCSVFVSSDPREEEEVEEVEEEEEEEEEE